MPPTHLCIVARPMRIADRALMFATMLFVASGAVGCDQLDGRSENRKGNAAFRDQKFVDAVAHLGVRHIDMPLSRDKVWRAIREAEAKKA